MHWRLLADATVAFHFAFIVFVVLGGLLVLRRRWAAWVHVPAVAWVVYLELTGSICPLTPLENAWRVRAGEAGYEGGFIDHYLMPVIYPAGLTPHIQALLGIGVLVLNLAVYALAVRRHGTRRHGGSP
ncbi:MAG: DUF2784 domain-containing protein [Burkholderiales bacterium]